MQNALSFWSALDSGRRLVVAGTTIAVFIGVMVLARMAASPPMSLLYAGLDPAASGEVVRALDQRSAVFEVRGNAIWVAATQRDQLRMTLASEGLPANDAAGYELLDQLSGFGTTAQMFDAAYLRAKEGELSRTISASPHVRSARVHIAVPQAQPFRRDQRAGASVTVTSATGALSPTQARAFRHLVASAVAGLQPEDVAVIDSASGLVPVSEEASGGIADDKVQELKRNVERMLEARVGPGRALVELSLDRVTERESVTERKFDPQGRVVISTESEERSNSSQGTPAGVTVASNLPEGDAAQGEGSRSQGAESRERVNYEVSETAREVVRTPGGVRRLTVAVLVDGIRNEEGSWQPRPDVELNDLRELVASATGFDAERGDVITIKSMEFQALPGAGDPVAAGFLAGIDLMALVQLLVVALVILALGLFVIRPVLLSGRRPPATPVALPGIAGAAGAVPVLDGEIDDGLSIPAFPKSSGAEIPGQATVKPEDPVERLRHLIAERQTESMEILRSWIEDREEEVR